MHQFEPNKIDLVVPSPDRQSADLFIVAGEWSGNEEQMRPLLQKVDTYLSFALDGQLVERFPELKGKPWRIVVQCTRGLPTGNALFVLEQIAAVVKEEGGDLVLIDATTAAE